MLIAATLASSAPSFARDPEPCAVPDTLPGAQHDRLLRERSDLLEQKTSLNRRIAEFDQEFGNIPETSPKVPMAQEKMTGLEQEKKNLNDAIEKFNQAVAAAAAGPGGTEVGRRAGRLRAVLARHEKDGPFHSPLNDPHLAEFVVSESMRTGVPVWLIMGQARRETSWGNPINGTTHDGRTFTDGTTGNAHNLFNLRPGGHWTGRVLDLGSRSGRFRVYPSYEDSIKDYLTLLSGDRYRGLTLEEIVGKYFPPEDNGGTAATEEYLSDLIRFSADFVEPGAPAITRETVPVP